jgi:hypothetical protein
LVVPVAAPLLKLYEQAAAVQTSTEEVYEIPKDGANVTLPVPLAVASVDVDESKALNLPNGAGWNPVLAVKKL